MLAGKFGAGTDDAHVDRNRENEAHGVRQDGQENRRKQRNSCDECDAGVPCKPALGVCEGCRRVGEHGTRNYPINVEQVQFADQTMSVVTSNNSILGTSSTETLSGASANDTIAGRGGDDQINAGAGNDVVFLGPSPVQSSDVLIVDGGSGTDTAILLGDRAEYTVSTTNNLVRLRRIEQFPFCAVDDCGTYLINVEQVQFADQTMSVVTSNNSILGTSSTETLSGTSANDTIAGRGGDDTINGNGGTDVVAFGGSSTSYIITKSGSTTNVRPNGCFLPCGSNTENVEFLLFSDLLMEL